jgi:ElaB/YqjD/DUF883 family membrane-anchored ribosome-binding protein
MARPTTQKTEQTVRENSEAAKAATGQSGGSDDLRIEIDALRRDLEKIIGTLGEMMKAQPEGLRQKLREGAEDLRHKGEEKVADAAAKASDAIADIEDYARRRPTRALAMAAGLGMLLGLLFGRS